MYFSNRKRHKRFWTMALIFFLCASIIMPKGLIWPERSNADPLLGSLALGAATGAVCGIIAEITKFYKYENYSISAQSLCKAAMDGAIKGVIFSLIIYAIANGALSPLLLKFGVSAAAMDPIIYGVQHGLDTVTGLFSHWDDLDINTQNNLIAKIETWAGIDFPCIELSACLGIGMGSPVLLFQCMNFVSITKEKIYSKYPEIETWVEGIEAELPDELRQQEPIYSEPLIDGIGFFVKNAHDEAKHFYRSDETLTLAMNATFYEESPKFSNAAHWGALLYIYHNGHKYVYNTINSIIYPYNTNPFNETYHSATRLLSRIGIDPAEGGTLRLGFDLQVYDSQNLLLESYDSVSNDHFVEIEIIPDSLPMSNGHRVSPVSGYQEDSFTFEVVYTDSDNQPPDSVMLYVDGQQRYGFTDIPDVDWGQGHTFSVDLTGFDVGLHTYAFEIKQGNWTDTRGGTFEVITDQPYSGDAAVSGLELSKYAMFPDSSITLFANFHNNGDQAQDIIANWYLMDPGGSQRAQVQRTYSAVPANTSTGQQQVTFSVPSNTGYWQAVVTLAAADADPTNNQASRNFYVGSSDDSSQYEVTSGIANQVGELITEPTGIYGFKPTEIQEGWVKGSIYKNGSLVWGNQAFSVGQIATYDGGQYLIYLEAASSNVHGSVVVIYHGTRSPNPLSYEPAKPRGAQGSDMYWSVTAIPGGELYDAASSQILLNDTVQGWYVNFQTDNGGEVLIRRFHIPADAPLGAQSFYIRDRVSLGSGAVVHYMKMCEMSVDPGHEISIYGLRPLDELIFNAGETVDIWASVTNHQGMYVENPELELTITGPGGYAYRDSLSLTVQGASTFDFMWNTTGLSHGDYTVSITSNIEGDINHSNNHVSGVIHLSGPILQVTPASVALEKKEGDIDYCITGLDIQNAGYGQLNWSASANVPWIYFYQTSGTAPLEGYLIAVLPQMLSAGTHHGTVTITAPGAIGSPFFLPVELKINPRDPDFTISLSPEMQSLRPGDTATYNMALDYVGSFNNPVNLSVTGLPVAATATFAENGVVPPGSVLLNIVTYTELALGTYPFQVVATDDTLSHTTSGTLVVAEPEIAVKQGSADIQTNTRGYDWGNLSPGSSQVTTFTIENAGNDTLTVKYPPRLFGSPAFNLTKEPDREVPPGGSTTFDITFLVDESTSRGEHLADIEIRNDDTDENMFIFEVRAYVPKLDHGVSYDLGVKNWGIDISDNYAYIAESDDINGGLRVADISDPLNIVEVGFAPIGFPAGKIKVIENFAYVSHYAPYNSPLKIIDVSNPQEPSVIGSIGGKVWGNDVTGNNALVCDNFRFDIYDVTNPANPTLVSSMDLGTIGYEVRVAGSFAYVAGHSGQLQIIDISDLENPSMEGFVDVSGTLHDLEVFGSHAYLAMGNGGFVIVDISNPQTPIIQSIASNLQYARKIKLIDNYALVTSEDKGLAAVDISDPANPFIIENLMPTESEYADVDTYGSYAVVTNWENGIEIIGIRNFLTGIIGSVDTGLAWGVKVADNYIYVGDGDNALNVVDVSDPLEPEILSSVATNGSVHEILPVGNYLYITEGWGSGFEVVDVNNPESPFIIADQSIFPQLPIDLQGIAVSGNYAYICAREFFIYDISDPLHPIYTSSYNNIGWTGFHAIAIEGNHVFIEDYVSKELVILDITDPQLPVEVSSLGLPDDFWDVSVSGGIALLAGDDSGLFVVDARDVLNPILASTVDIGKVVHTYSKGKHGFIPVTYHNLHIFDFSDPTNPALKEVVETPGDCHTIDVDGQYAYVGDGEPGLQIIDLLPLINELPGANAGPDQTVEEGNMVTLDGTASADSDFGLSAYSWEQTSGTRITLSDPSAAAPSFEAPATGVFGETLTFRLTVTDVGGLKAYDTCTIQITGDDDPPEADAGADQQVDENFTVTLDGTGSKDLDGLIVEYLWTQTGGSIVVLSDTQNVQPTFSTPNVTSAGETLTFELTVADNGGRTASDSCSVQVIGVNDPPSANAGTNMTVPENASFILDGSSSTDPDDGIASYLWEQISGPAVDLSQANNHARPEIIPPDVGMAGAILGFRLIVTDGEGLQDSDECEVTVNWVNAPPVANAGEDQTVNEGLNFTLSGVQSSDEDDGIASYQWIQIDGPPTSFSSTQIDQPIVITPDVGPGGADLVYQLTAKDQSGDTSSDTCSVHVNYINNAPVAENLVVALDEDMPAEVVLQVDEPDDNELIYVLESLPSRGVLSGTTPNLIYTPDSNYFGTDSFSFKVNDGFVDSNVATVTLNITSINDLPLSDAGPDQNVATDSPVLLSAANSFDPDDGIAAFLWEQTGGPDVGIDGSVEEKVSFQSPADINQAGASLTFQLTTQDNSGDQTSDICIVNVVTNNQPPVADAGLDIAVSTNTTASLNGIDSTDPEDAGLSFDWTQIDGTAVTLSDTQSDLPSFQSPSLTTAGSALKFRLTVTDAVGLKSQDLGLVNVSDLYQPPVADTGSNQVVDIGESVILDGSLSFDNDGDIIGYLWKQTNGSPPVTLSDPTAIQPDFVAPDVSLRTDLIFRLIVKDSQNLESQAAIIVTVLPEMKGDTENDGDVDGVDLVALIEELGTSGCAPEAPCLCDFNSDGAVNELDLADFAVMFGFVK